MPADLGVGCCLANTGRFWHHITPGQRQLLDDIKVLRELSIRLMNVDCVTFMRMVDMLKQTSMRQVSSVRASLNGWGVARSVCWFVLAGSVVVVVRLTHCHP